MQLCYVDESGDDETLVDTEPDQQPVIVIAGITLPESDLTAVTHEWIELKTRFHPTIASSGRGWLDAILADIKGSKCRGRFRASASPREKQHAVGFIDGTLKILERHSATLIGRVRVKELGHGHNDINLYSSTLQFICGAFDAGLPADERGMVVVDSQTYRHNYRLAHSIFTQRFATSPKHVGLVDMPVFGHSDNHAGLQIADMLCSAVLAPIACTVYAGGSYGAWNRHCDRGYLKIREKFGKRLKALTFEWNNTMTGKKTSSVVVNDPLSKRGARLLWAPT